MPVTTPSWIVVPPTSTIDPRTSSEGDHEPDDDRVDDVGDEPGAVRRELDAGGGTGLRLGALPGHAAVARSGAEARSRAVGR